MVTTEENKYLMSTPLNCPSKIWAIGGGKGGVGKSMATANLSISLASMGYKVTAVDLDIGGANLHTCMGISIPKKTLSDYINRDVESINDLVVKTPIKNISIISGAQDTIGIADLKYSHKRRILYGLSQLDSDFILIDLGAGTSFNTLDFFLVAQEKILLVLPEPTSIENAYRFIRSMYYRKLSMIEELFELGPIIKNVFETKTDEFPTKKIEKIIKINPKLGHLLKTEIKKIRPRIIINQVRSKVDVNIGESMKTICKKYFGIELDYAGYFEYDPTVWQSIKQKKVLMIDFPTSKITENFYKVSRHILQ